MSTLCPRYAIVSLIQAGWSEARIAAACGTSQSTIHRVKSGKQQTVSFVLGTALVQLATQQGVAGPVAGQAPAAVTPGR